MNILQLTKKVPYPLKDGESIAIHYLSKGLVEIGCNVSLLAINTKKHFVQLKGRPHEMLHYSEVDTVYLDNTITFKDAFVNLVTNKSYNIERFRSDDFSEKLIEILAQKSFDVIQLETLYMASYIKLIKKYSDAKISMRSHNLENEIWSNLSQSESHLAKKYYYGLCATRLKNYEIDIINDYDVLLPISKIDSDKYQTLGYDGVQVVAPVGLELKEYFTEPKPLTKPIKLGYIGSMDWKPNIEGIDWFIEHCWPGIKKKFPDIEFHLAGRNMSSSYKELDIDGLVVKGEVDDARLFIHSLDILVVPLFSGSGIRVKILEAMAMGKAVMSTSKGFEGIPIIDKTHGLIFSNVEELIGGLSLLLSTPTLAETIQNEGQKLVTNSFGYKAIASKVRESYLSLLS